MDKEVLQSLLRKAAGRLDVLVEGQPVFGWHQKSIGARVLDRRGTKRWLRLLAWGKEQSNDRLWTGLKASASIQGVRKPLWLRDCEWEEGVLRIRSDLVEYIDDRTVSDTPELRFDLELRAGWLPSLRSSLQALHKSATDRIAIRQDLVTRRLRERFGDRVDAEVREWEPSHGDLHWANLTRNECCLLDWEAWGIAPKGFDVALLFAFTLQSPETANAVSRIFEDWLDCEAGRKAQMFACAELMRMTELYSDHEGLYEPLSMLAASLAQRDGLTVLKA